MRQILPPLRRSDRSRRRWLAAVLCVAGAVATRCARAATAAEAVVNAPPLPAPAAPHMPADAAMLLLRQTPLWAWALLLLLMAFGRQQMSERERTRAGLLLGPLVIGLLSLSGVGQAFGLSLAGHVAWLLGVLLALLLNGMWWQQPRGLRYLRERDTVMVPGSGWPLALMLAVLSTRCVVTASLALGWQSAGDPVFVVSASALLGLLAGGFISRAAVIWRRCPSPF